MLESKLWHGQTINKNTKGEKMVEFMTSALSEKCSPSWVVMIRT